MNKQQIQVACDYINAHVRELHNFDDKVDLIAQVGPDIGPDNVVKADENRGQIVIIVNRGIKGLPKYRLDPKALEALAAKQKAVVEVAVKPTNSKPAAKGRG